MKKSEFRSTLKITSLFSGVQVIKILVSIVRSKLTAILLGSSGIGILGLLTSGVGVISVLTSFDLRLSGTKAISEAKGERDSTKIQVAYGVLKRLVLYTAILGLMLTLLLSRVLSWNAFGDISYAWSFAILSLMLFFNQVTAGNIALIKGTRRTRLFIKTEILGSILSLFSTIPLYYLFGIWGIAPALALGAITTYLTSEYYVRSINIGAINLSKSDFIEKGKQMMSLGGILSISSLTTVLTAYLIRAYISNYGSMRDVGLYVAGFALITTYVGMIFQAMSTDYFPKLTENVSNTKKTFDTINVQAIIALILISPLLVLLINVAGFFIPILYTKDFLGMTQMVQLATLGVVFKTLSWSMSFLLLAKSDKVLFLFAELSTNAIVIILNTILYKTFGLNGLGFAYVLTNLLYGILIYIIVRVKYSFRFSRLLISIFLINASFVMISIFQAYYFNFKGWMTSFILVFVAVGYNLYQLNQQTNLIKRFK